MPPVDRNEPRRADSSESTYSLIEFMREFPDDAACLEHLWRTRYAPDGEHAHCPKCDQERVFRKVSHRWLQGYLNEFVWRYNLRHQREPSMFAELAGRAAHAAQASRCSGQ